MITASSTRHAFCNKYFLIETANQTKRDARKLAKTVTIQTPYEVVFHEQNMNRLLNITATIKTSQSQNQELFRPPEAPPLRLHTGSLLRQLLHLGTAGTRKPNRSYCSPPQ